jgi:hypothetical protein
MWCLFKKKKKSLFFLLLKYDKLNSFYGHPLLLFCFSFFSSRHIDRNVCDAEGGHFLLVDLLPLVVLPPKKTNDEI